MLAANIYQQLALRTNDGQSTERVHCSIEQFKKWSKDYDKEELKKGIIYDPGELLNGALGLTGEAGEVSDIIKKHIFHGHALNVAELVKELGDVCWYVSLLSYAVGYDLSEVMTRNIEKLKARYPEGFSETMSINRKG